MHIVINKYSIFTTQSDSRCALKLKKMRNLPLTIKFQSPGHYKLITTRYNKEVTLLTTDMELIDAIKDGKKSAIRQAIRLTRLNAFLTY